MEGEAQVGASAAPPSRGSGLVAAGRIGLAALALLAIVDLAIETFWSGSPIRWWVAPPAIAFVALTAWLWRPGGWAAKRWGSLGAASWSTGGLLGLVAVSAWLPGGHTDGVRMLLQPTGTVLTAVTLAAVLLAATVLLEGVVFVPARARLLTGAVLVVVIAYALAALAFALWKRVPFAFVLHGGAFWQALPWWLQGPAVAGTLLIPGAIIVHFMLAVRHAGVAGVARWRVRRPVALTLVLALVLSALPGAAGSGSTPASAPAAGAPAGGVADERAIADLLDAAIAGPDGGPVNRAEAADRLAFLIDQASTLDKGLPKDTFEPGSIVASVGSDPAALCVWVREATSYAPYRGVLRGPIGVLMDRFGNSLDRALLMAELLRLAGRRVRIAHATLGPDATRALTERTAGTASKPAASAPPPDVTLPTEQVLGAFARHFRLAPDRLVRAGVAASEAGQAAMGEARRQSVSQAQALLAALGPRRTVSGDAALPTTADHWWAQYERDGEWVDCDPDGEAGPSGRRSVAAAQTSYRVDELPEDVYWTVEVRVVVERLADGRLTENTVLRHRMRPADLIDKEVSLRHVPLKFPAKAVADRGAAELRRAVLGTKDWIPVLSVGDSRVIQGSFNVDGSVNPRPATGGISGPGTDMFGGLLVGEEAGSSGGGVLTAEWVDYEYSARGTPPRKVRRESFDLLGPAARAGGGAGAAAIGEAERLKIGLTLLGQTSILLQVAQPSVAFLAHRVLDRLVKNGPQAAALLRSTKPATPKDASRAVAALSPLSDVLWNYAFLRSSISQVSRGVYLDAPSIATVRTSFTMSGTDALAASALFDVVSNDIGAVGHSSGPPFDAGVAQGVADTAAERAALGRDAGAENTLDIFGAAAARQVPSVVIRRGIGEWSKPSGLTADVAQRIRRDADDECDVVVPMAPVTVGGANRIGWWRVCGGSGTTIGVMDSGFHSDLLEYLEILLEDILDVTGVFTLMTFADAYPLSAAFIPLVGLIAGLIAGTYLVRDGPPGREAPYRPSSGGSFGGGSTTTPRRR